MSKEAKYRIKNWSSYNKSLVQRSSLTVWFDKNIIDSWYERKITCKKGRPIGDKVMARTLERQAKEIGIKCLAINTMNKLGMPVH